MRVRAIWANFVQNLDRSKHISPFVEITLNIRDRLLSLWITPLVYTLTSKDFLDPKGVSIERQEAAVLSFDQELGPSLGAFLRVGGLSDKAAVDHDAFFSGGLQIQGRLWGRDADNLGLGAAYLYGGNKDIKNTRIAEAYYRFVITSQFGLSADIQYMKNDKKSGKDPKGFILGIRADAHF